MTLAPCVLPEFGHAKAAWGEATTELSSVSSFYTQRYYAILDAVIATSAAMSNVGRNIIFMVSSVFCLRSTRQKPAPWARSQ